jgi:hypothetical protein
MNIGRVETEDVMRKRRRDCKRECLVDAGQCYDSKDDPGRGGQKGVNYGRRGYANKLIVGDPELRTEETLDFEADNVVST